MIALLVNGRMKGSVPLHAVKEFNVDNALLNKESVVAQVVPS